MTTVANTLESLQSEWKHLYQDTLPSAARSKSPSQPTWPVHNDHCFARIILDNTIGISTPWTAKLKSPAWKNMSETQLRDCVALGKKILEGEVDLVELDGRSLDVRGKKRKGEEEGKVKSKYFTKLDLGKRGRDVEDAKQEGGSPTLKKQKLFTEFINTTNPLPTQPTTTTTSDEDDLAPYLRKISLSTKTPFQKRVLSLLCQVPRGQYTTYGAISTYLSSSPRAVGNAIRNNPFAPYVPCHRILATGGGIGGFYGSWGRNGEKGLNDDKKRELLRGEGVKFDGRGKVVGRPWEGFK